MPLFIDKEHILSKIPQEAIFEKYGVPYKEGLFRSTLRKDDNPTCSFYTKRGKLIMRDFSGHFWGDCFDLVQKVYGVNYGEALQIIGKDFGFEDGIEKVPIIPSVLPERTKTSIRVKRRPWSKIVSKFWKEYEITKDTIDKFKVYPADMVWINGEPVYKYSPSQPAYIYHWSEYNYQIYFPFASKNRPRFLISDGSLIHGFEQLPLQGDLLVITKSRKDVMCLYEHSIWSISPIAESVVLGEEVIDILRPRFKRIISLMDYDNTGIHNAWMMRKLYGIEPFFFTEKLWGRKLGFRGAKDFSDYKKIYKFNKTQNLINHVKRTSGYRTESKRDFAMVPA